MKKMLIFLFVISCFISSNVFAIPEIELQGKIGRVGRLLAMDKSGGICEVAQKPFVTAVNFAFEHRLFTYIGQLEKMSVRVSVSKGVRKKLEQLKSLRIASEEIPQEVVMEQEQKRIADEERRALEQELEIRRHQTRLAEEERRREKAEQEEEDRQMALRLQESITQVNIDDQVAMAYQQDEQEDTERRRQQEQVVSDEAYARELARQFEVE